MNGALLFDLDFQRHDTGPGHPESPQRLKAVEQALQQGDWFSRLHRLTPRAATGDELKRVHGAAYLETVRRDVAAGLDSLTTGDTQISADSLEIALLASGGVLESIDWVMEQAGRRAFCGIRPPGHHATPDKGMGFCLFNHVALAARHAQAVHGVSKVAIIDWDVHHGNGTQDTFYRDGSVFFFSSHQSPWYPFSGWAEETGEDQGKGSTLNVPLAAGAGMTQLEAAFNDRLLPALDDFAPELVLISAGFDSRLGDPLGQLTLEDADFATLTRHLLEIAGRHSDGRVVSLLEGGYHLDGLRSAVSSHLDALMEEAP